MNEDNPDLKEEIKVALDILKKRLQVSSRVEAMAHLLNKYDQTLLQIAARRVKLGATKGTAQEEDES